MFFAMKAKNCSYVTAKTPSRHKAIRGELQAKYCSAQISATH